MAKLKALGRGLDALLASDVSAPAVREAAHTLPIGALRPGRYQPRTRMDQASLAALAESIKAQGVLQPILARPLSDGGYEIIAGERRWRAAQLAGLTDVPVLVREIADEAALAAALIENIQREDLNPLEEAAGIKRLLEEFGMTHEAAAHAVGRSRAAVSNLLRLLQLTPAVRDLLLGNEIEMGHARALLSLGAEKQLELAHKIVAKGYSVREVERMVQALGQAPKTKHKPRVDRDVQRLQEELSESLGTRVLIKAKKNGKGELLISYGSLTQLDALLARLRK